MKITSPAVSIALSTLLSPAILFLGPQSLLWGQTAAGTPPPPPHTFPVPTNLKVLPKDLTGQEVHEIMHRWEAALGAKCSTCHTANPNDLAPDGRPRLNYADDSKPEKATARLMYKMTEEINSNYVGKVENSGVPVSCGTCHRGHIAPEPFVAPEEHEHHEGGSQAGPHAHD